MRFLILFALLAAACALPVPPSGKFSSDEKEALKALFDVLRTTARTNEVYAENIESEEREKKTFLIVLDKVQAAVENDDLDNVEIQDGEEEAYLTLFLLMDELDNSVDGNSKTDIPPVVRRVRSVLAQ